MNVGTAPPLPGIDPATEHRSAILSPDGLYRYRLTRRWGPGPTLTFVMLNPSTADALQDDPTIRRCRRFAQDLGFDGLDVLNLYAWRATNPNELLAIPTGVAVGPDNPAHLSQACAAARTGATTLVAAWGAHPAARIFTAPSSPAPWYRLGPPTKDGHPRHPLYLPASTRLEPHP